MDTYFKKVKNFRFLSLYPDSEAKDILLYHRARVRRNQTQFVLKHGGCKVSGDCCEM